MRVRQVLDVQALGESLGSEQGSTRWEGGGRVALSTSGFLGVNMGKQGFKLRGVSVHEDPRLLTI